MKPIMREGLLKSIIGVQGESIGRKIDSMRLEINKPKDKKGNNVPSGSRIELI